MMNEQENAQQIQPEADDVEVEVVEQEAVVEASPDDELENYTKSVSKRINKLNERNRQAEEKAADLERRLAQKEQETAYMAQERLQTHQTLIQKEKEAIQAKEMQADDLYRKAVDSGDAELMSKADTLKSDLSIQKEKVRMAEAQSQQTFQNPQPVQQQPQQYQEQAPATVEPSTQAKSWHDKNQWYGDSSNDDNVQATQFAYFTHYNLINEGYEADSDDYYSELNNRVYKVYPDLQGNNDVQTEDRPTVQRVASTSVGSRQKTQGKKNGVTFSKSEVERLRGLKPHNMSEDAWLKSVAKEKQKISQREAK
jgi:hypothetical protein